MRFLDATQQLLLLVLPVAAYLVAARSGTRTRLQLIIASALGGAAAGLLICIVVALGARSFLAVLDLWTWVLLYTMAGALIGLSGVVARAFGAWLARRP